MSLESTIKPINGRHSIKEAVLSVFIPNPIIKPERLKGLLDDEFKDIFQRFDIISQFVAEIKNDKGVFSNKIKPPENVGVQYSSFKEGKIEKVLQCQNQEKRNFIAYHDLNYTRWTDFFERFRQLMGSISKFEPSIFINGFSLHYIDEFLWINTSEIDCSVVFDEKSKYLPREFFKPGKTDYTLTTERLLSNQSTISDRLQIKVEPAVVPKISISHSITQPLADFAQLSHVISNEFSDYFNVVHSNNKELLKDILKPEVCKLIGI